MAHEPIAVDTAAEGISLPARLIPWPKSISDEARAMLTGAESAPRVPMPVPGDVDAWRAFIAELDRDLLPIAEYWLDPAIPMETKEIAGVTVHFARPVGHDPTDLRVYVEIHGGGLVSGAGAFCHASAAIAAARHGVQAVAIDYRMPPDHPFPAALDDCVAVYRHLTEHHGADRLIVGGASAGGNLAAALMLRARDEGLPLPAALLLMTPEVDLTESGDTFETLIGLDPILWSRLTEANALYAGAWPLDHPYLSPLFGDLAGLPPTLVQSGTRDLFLSNAVRMHRALREAGVAAELHVFEAMPHGGFFSGPEDEAMNREIARFVAAHWR